MYDVAPMKNSAGVQGRSNNPRGILICNFVFADRIYANNTNCFKSSIYDGAAGCCYYYESSL